MSARASRRSSALRFAMITGTVLILSACTSQSAAPTSGTTGSTVASIVAPGPATPPAAGVVNSASTSSSAPGLSTPTSVGAPPVSAPSSTIDSTKPTRPTTVVPAPGGGNVSQTVPSATVVTAAPVSLSATASFGGKITASIVKVTPFDATAQGAGEVSGPAVSVTVRISNGSAKPVDLSGVVVNLADKAGSPSSPMLGSPASALIGSVKPGGTSDGVYVFSLAKSHINPISVSVSVSTGAPIVLFVGDAK